jgi:hypothetical protein
MTSETTRKHLRLALLAGFYLCLIFGGRWLGLVIEDGLRELGLDKAGVPYLGAVAAILLVYVILTAIPFVPGTEIGVALLLVFGAPIAPIVYLSTIAALSLAFAVGRLVPEPKLAGWLARHGFFKLAGLIDAFVRLGPERRDRYLTRTAPRWLRPWLVDHRMITFVVLINLPGNTLVGGGGGIALVTGLSKLMPVRQFLLGVALAVAPVPIAVVLASWLGG